MASISSQSDEIGKLIAEAMHKVGKDGVITVEDNQQMATELEFVEGMQFDRGYISPYMVYQHRPHGSGARRAVRADHRPQGLGHPGPASRAGAGRPAWASRS